MTYKNCQYRFIGKYARYKIKSQKLPKTFKILSKWRNCAKSGHTVCYAKIKHSDWLKIGIQTECIISA